VGRRSRVHGFDPGFGEGLYHDFAA